MSKCAHCWFSYVLPLKLTGSQPPNEFFVDSAGLFQRGQMSEIFLDDQARVRQLFRHQFMRAHRANEIFAAAQHQCRYDDDC